MAKLGTGTLESFLREDIFNAMLKAFTEEERNEVLKRQDQGRKEGGVMCLIIATVWLFLTNSDRLSSVNDEGLKNLIAVRQCLVSK
jgi:hypothetical protein